MGDALVGGYAKSKEDFSGIWIVGDDFLCSVFGIRIFLIEKDEYEKDINCYRIGNCSGHRMFFLLEDA